MNLILSTAAGYNWGQLEIFIKSLRKIFREKVILVLNNPNTDLVNKLKDFNIDFLDTKIVPSDSYQSRYQHYYNYLKNNNIFEQVLLTDSRDVFFQNNPFNFFYKKNLNFFLEDDYIKNSSVNIKWIKRTTGKSILEKIKDKKISCCGQVIGRYQSILDYCDVMRKNIIIHKYKPSIHSFLFKRKIKGWDQGIHNYLVYSDIFKNIDFYDNSNGDVATLSLNKRLNFNNKGRLINKNGNEYSIIHQYDHFADSFKNLIYKICD
jgi:hypothetical protein